MQCNKCGAELRQGRGPGVAGVALVAVLLLGGVVYFAMNSWGKNGGQMAQSAVLTPTPAHAQPAGPAQGAGPVAVSVPPKAQAPTASPTPAPSPAPSKPNLGTAQVKPLAKDKVVDTKAWGPVPINQVGVVLREGLKKPDAEGIAKAMGAVVVGEMAYINMYQLEAATTNEADLQALLSKAKATSGVELAFPLQMVDLFVEIKGARCSNLSDPVYSGPNGVPYAMTGVQAAWDYIRASGVALSDVQVGVTDTGIYKGNDEFDGPTRVDASEVDDSVNQPENGSDGRPEPYGTHGTAVTGIIGANGDNGGMVGVASPLGRKMSVTVTNVLGGKYGGSAPARPDPSDPTKFVSGGRTYSIGPLVAIQKQIEKGVTIINCSWGTSATDANGNPNGNPDLAAAYRRFFEKLARDNPKVLILCAAGNNGKSVDGSKWWPGGAPLPNVITVGNLDNDGSRWKSSNMAGPGFEVTLGAPGHRVVSGVSADGRVSNEYGGTSFATPQVTATAAMLRSINPNLTAADIKRILVETAGTEVNTSGKKVAVDASVGGRALRVDEAVLKVINDQRGAKGLPVLDKNFLQKLGTIDAVARSDKDPREYTIRSTVGAVGEQGADVKIELWGEGAIDGDTTKHLTSAGDASWGVSIINEKSNPGVKVTRLDTNACSTIQLAPLDIAGTWSGTMVFTDVQVNTETIEIPDPFDDTKPPTVITREECEKSAQKDLNKDQKIQMTFAPNSAESGMVTFASAQKMPPTEYHLSGDWLTIDLQQKEWHTHFEGQVTDKEGGPKISGSMRMWLGTSAKVLIEAKGVWAVARPK